MTKQGLNKMISRAVLCLSILMSGGVVASAATVVNLPITFSAEGHPVRTSACLQVKETLYPKQGWWQESTGSDTAGEKAFKSVLTAIKRKDKSELLSLTDPAERDPKKFEEQAQAFFQQLDVLDIDSVPRAYELDGLAVFYAKIKSKTRSFYAPFIFRRETDGSFGFLPYRTNQVSFQLVQDWFTTPWGPAGTESPAYCSADELKDSGYKTSLVPDQDWNPSYVLVQGAPLDNPGAFAKQATQVKSTIQAMHAVISKGQVDEFAKRMTPEGADKLKKWWSTATDTEKTAYENSVAQQQPFFLIDAAPLLVVYTKSSAGQIEVMYFVQQNGELYWANSAHISVADKVFKQGPLRKSAGLKDPFTNIATK